MFVKVLYVLVDILRVFNTLIKKDQIFVYKTIFWSYQFKKKKVDKFPGKRKKLISYYFKRPWKLILSQKDKESANNDYIHPLQSFIIAENNFYKQNTTINFDSDITFL